MKGTQGTLAVGAVLVCLALAGCEGLPRSGPDHKAIASQAVVYDKGDGAKPALNYALFDLTPRVLSYFPQQKQQTADPRLWCRAARRPTLPLGVGDVVEVTLFEFVRRWAFHPGGSGQPSRQFHQPASTDGRFGWDHHDPLRGPTCGRRADDRTGAERHHRPPEGSRDRASGGHQSR